MELLLAGIDTAESPNVQEAQIARLTARAAAHRQAQAAALAANPEQIPEVALRLRELSALRYGVDPILSAAAIQVFALRYPADVPQPRKHVRPAQSASVPAANVPPSSAETSNGSPTSSAKNPAEAGAGALVPAQDWLAPPRRVKLE